MNNDTSQELSRQKRHQDAMELFRLRHGRAGPQAQPSLFNRFTSAFSSQPNLTEDRLARKFGMTPSMYANWRTKQAAGGGLFPYPPAETGTAKAVEWMGRTAKKILDPVGIGIAALTKNPTQVLAGSGLYEAGTEAANQLASTNKIESIPKIAQQGLYGAVGARIGDKFILPNRLGILGEVAGRSTFKPSLETGIQDTLAYTTENLPTIPLKKKEKPYKTMNHI